MNRRNFIVSKSSVDLGLDVDVERLRSFIPITDQFLLFLDRERSFARVVFLFEESRFVENAFRSRQTSRRNVWRMLGSKTTGLEKVRAFKPRINRINSKRKFLFDRSSKWTFLWEIEDDRSSSSLEIKVSRLLNGIFSRKGKCLSVFFFFFSKHRVKSWYS